MVNDAAKWTTINQPQAAEHLDHLSGPSHYDNDTGDLTQEHA